MKTVRQVLKTSAIFSLMGAFGVHSGLKALTHRERWSRSYARARLASRYAKWGLKILGVEIVEQGRPPKSQDNALFVGNHLSYLDVLILASLVPTNFVTSEEIRETKGLGALCELGACLFVERRSRARLETEVSELTEALKNGLNITIFPEATSTDGSSVLRFRRPLFKAAIEASRMVAPFCLNYHEIDGESVGHSNRDTVCWYGEMEFISHLWNLAKRRRITVHLTWSDRLSPFDEMGERQSTQALADRSHAQVSAHFRPLDLDRGENEKPRFEAESWAFPALS